MHFISYTIRIFDQGYFWRYNQSNLMIGCCDWNPVQPCPNFLNGHELLLLEHIYYTILQIWHMYYVFYDCTSFLTYITINISSFLMFLMVLSLLSLCFKFLHTANILKFWPYVLDKRFEQFLKWTVSKMYTVQSKDIKTIQWCSFNVFDVNFGQCLMFIV